MEGEAWPQAPEDQMKAIREQIAHTLADATSFPRERILELFKLPDTPERGDVALPCFPFAKTLKRKPNQIAAEWTKLFADDPTFAGVGATGPFLNFTYSGPALAERVLKEALADPEAYGNGGEGAGKTVVIDFSSPNIAKPIAFHHIRSTMIGHAVANLHEARGWKTVRINYLGDWGTQFGKLIVAYRRWGSMEELQKRKIRHLLEVYVRFHREIETEPGLEEEARRWFVRMEGGDREALGLWRLFYDISLEEFNRVYRRLGVHFDFFEGESDYRDRLDETIDLVNRRAGVTRSEGAWVVDLSDDGLPPCLLRKADGATLYATRDIAAAIDRSERFTFDRSLYVVDHRQSMHFRQFFRVLTKMGYAWAALMEHVPFGMLQLKDRTMSTREGEVIFLDDVLDRAVELAREAIEEKNAALAGKDEVARQVGIGAIIFGDLVNRRGNDVTFEWERILNFQGETGVYVQYTHARCRSMLRKAGGVDGKLFDPQFLSRREEKDVLKLLGQFPDRVERGCIDCDPSQVARLLIELCRAFNRVYTIEGYRFLDPDPKIRATRLTLAEGCVLVLRRGLSLLGLEAPEEM